MGSKNSLVKLETSKVDMNQNSKILAEIMEIKFTYLNSLSLYGNNLNSIEVLCRIKMHKIEDLYSGKYDYIGRRL